jgi:NitT/TauT family transport system substrate-binding protein
MTHPPRSSSRREVLQMSAVAATFGGATSFLATRLLAAGGQKIKMIQASPATLLLWSVSYLAEDLGYYREEGIEIERVGLGGGPAAMTALLAGEGHANVSAPGECLAANARGQRIKIIESYAKNDGYTLSVTKSFADGQGVTASSPLGTRVNALTAMKGRRVGVTAPNSNTDLVMRMALRQVGLDPKQDVTIVPAGSVINIISGMAQGALDGGMLLAPFTEQATATFGAVPLLSMPAGEIQRADRLQGQVLEVRPDDLAQNRNLFESLIRADLRAWKFLHETPDEAGTMLRRSRFPKIGDEIWSSAWKNQLPIFDTPLVSKDTIQAWIETGSIGGNPDTTTFPYDEVIDMSLVEEGLNKLGWKPKN